MLEVTTNSFKIYKKVSISTAKLLIVGQFDLLPGLVNQKQKNTQEKLIIVVRKEDLQKEIAIKAYIFRSDVCLMDQIQAYWWLDNRTEKMIYPGEPALRFWRLTRLLELTKSTTLTQLRENQNITQDFIQSIIIWLGEIMEGIIKWAEEENSFFPLTDFFDGRRRENRSRSELPKELEEALKLISKN